MLQFRVQLVGDLPFNCSHARHRSNARSTADVKFVMPRLFALMRSFTVGVLLGADTQRMHAKCCYKGVLV